MDKELTIYSPNNLYYLLGPIGGFVAFFLGVVTMEGIFIRPDHHGNKQFSMDGFYEYLKLPFNWRLRHTAWGTLYNISPMTRLKLLNLNWVFMMGLGSIISGGIYYYKK